MLLTHKQEEVIGYVKASVPPSREEKHNTKNESSYLHQILMHNKKKYADLKQNLKIKAQEAQKERVDPPYLSK